MSDVALLARWAVLTLGVVYFITESAFFTPVRVWLARKSVLLMALLYCASCTGFWIGFALAFWTWPFGMNGYQWLVPFESGVAAMGLGALWNAWRGPNQAYLVEQGVKVHDDDAPQSETRTGSAEETASDVKG